jgi:hypothetical protein
MNNHSFPLISLIRSRRIGLACAGAALACCTAAYGGGTIVVDNDEWTLSDAGFSSEGAANGTAYAQNAAKFLTGGSGSILIDSGNFGLAGGDLNTALTTGGYTVTEDPSTPFTLANLSAYKAVFLGGNTLPSDYVSVLSAYVNGGGGLYIAEGTGDIGSEGAYWTSFLKNFGLSTSDPYNGIVGTVPVVSSSPVLAGVSQLFYDNGDTVSLSPLTQIYSGTAQVITYDGSDGLIATFSSSVPDDTSTLFLAGLSLALLGFGARHFSSKAERA